MSRWGEVFGEVQVGVFAFELAGFSVAGLGGFDLVVERAEIVRPASTAGASFNRGQNDAERSPAMLSDGSKAERFIGGFSPDLVSASWRLPLPPAQSRSSSTCIRSRDSGVTPHQVVIALGGNTT